MKLNPLWMIWASTRFILVLIVLFVAWQIWVFSRPIPRDYTENEKTAIKSVLLEALKPLKSSIGNQETRFGVAHFLHDSNDEATKTVKQLISQEKKWIVIETSLIQQFLIDISQTILNATSFDEVINAGKRVNIDVIVAGDVIRVDSTKEETTASIKFCAYDVRRGKWLAAGTYEKKLMPSLLKRISIKIRSTSGILRLIIWIAFAAFLPWVTSSATYKTIEYKSNLASFTMLSIYVLLDMALAMAFWEFKVEGLWGAIKLLITLAICGFYNYWACEKIAQKE